MVAHLVVAQRDAAGGAAREQRPRRSSPSSGAARRRATTSRSRRRPRRSGARSPANRPARAPSPPCAARSDERQRVADRRGKALVAHAERGLQHDVEGQPPQLIGQGHRPVPWPARDRLPAEQRDLAGHRPEALAVQRRQHEPADAQVLAAVGLTMDRRAGHRRTDPGSRRGA